MKIYSFIYPGDKEQFDIAVDQYRAEMLNDRDNTTLFEKENGNYSFGVYRGGHSGGYWYCPCYEYKDGKLIISGKIRYCDYWSQQTGAKRVLNKIEEILLYVILSPLILVALLTRGVIHIYRKIFKKSKPQSNEEKALFALMIEHLNCKPQ